MLLTFNKYVVILPPIFYETCHMLDSASNAAFLESLPRELESLEGLRKMNTHDNARVEGHRAGFLVSIREVLRDGPIKNPAFYTLLLMLLTAGVSGCGPDIEDARDEIRAIQEDMEELRCEFWNRSRFDFDNEDEQEYNEERDDLVDELVEAMEALGNLSLECCGLFCLLAVAVFGFIGAVLWKFAQGCALMERKDWSE